MVAAIVDAAPTVPSAVLPPTPAEIDEVLDEYDAALRLYTAAKELLDQHKAIVVFHVDHWGIVPADAKQSKRLEGKLHTGTITRAESINVDEKKVMDLHFELSIATHGEVFFKLFSVSTKHKLLEGAAEYLRTAQLPQRLERKVMSLFGQCFQVKTNSPSVKVEIREAEKRAARCGGKAGR